jgi:extradiol dioxygenase family protein
MLTEHPIDVMLTATDLGATKRFYGDRVGLDVSIESDVAAEVAERAHGVDVVDYDDPGLKTVDGVTDVGFAPSAWLVDPGGTTIGLLQLNDEQLG